MAQDNDHQTVSFLRQLWDIPDRKELLVATFIDWIQHGASRNEAKSRLKTLCSEQHYLTTLATDSNSIDWDQLTEFLCLCFYQRHHRKPLPTIPSDEQWQKLTDKRFWRPLTPHPQQEKAIIETVPVTTVPLEQILLAEGGKRLVYRYEPDLQLLLEQGKFFDGPREYIKGTVRACHANAAQLWHKHPDLYSIATGYALSADGLWRQHSWAMISSTDDKTATIIETTVTREKYFGVLLTSDDAATFYKMNAFF